jgi:hypothetical protein
MICTHCGSPKLRGPSYEAIPGGRRHAAILRCLHCGRAFDAYRAFGEGAVAAVEGRVAA